MAKISETSKNIIDQKLSDVEDCRLKKSILIGNVNKFIWNYSTLNNCSKRKLFQSYCTSFYGSELWSLSSKGLVIHFDVLT